MKKPIFIDEGDPLGAAMAAFVRADEAAVMSAPDLDKPVTLTYAQMCGERQRAAQVLIERLKLISETSIQVAQ